MRIGINARFLHSDILEGLGRYTWEVISRMIRNNPNDEFFFFSDRPVAIKYRTFSNVKYIITGPAARHPILFLLWFDVYLPQAVKRVSLDVFYSPDNFMSRRLNCPTVLVVHDLAYLAYPEHYRISHLWYYQKFMPQFIRKAAHIITVSHSVKEDVLARFNVSSSKISVGYNALPDRPNHKGNRVIDQPYFIYVGSINPRKNLVRALHGFEIFRESHPDFIFVLIGKLFGLSTSDSAFIEDMISRGLVIHLQGIDDDVLTSYIAHSTAMVYVSLFEGFGIPLLEAMASGVPVITSDVTSMPEVAGDAALLVDPTNEKDISLAMSNIVDSFDLRQELISKGYDRVKQFSWEDTSGHTYKVLKQVVVNKNGY